MTRHPTSPTSFRRRRRPRSCRTTSRRGRGRERESGSPGRGRDGHRQSGQRRRGRVARSDTPLISDEWISSEGRSRQVRRRCSPLGSCCCSSIRPRSRAPRACSCSSAAGSCWCCSPPGRTWPSRAAIRCRRTSSSGSSVAARSWLPRRGCAAETSDFDLLVADAIDDLPVEFQRLLDDTPVVVSQHGVENRAYGHYFGDTVARDNYPDRIVLYQDTLERDFGHDPELAARPGGAHAEARGGPPPRLERAWSTRPRVVGSAAWPWTRTLSSTPS